MSWLYSRALVAEFSGGNSLAGGLCVPSNTTHIEPPYWLHGKTTDFLNPSRFGRMCGHLTAYHGAALLMWFREGLPAKVSQQRARVPGWMTQEASLSSKCSESLARFDLDSCSWKTPQSSEARDLHWSSVNLPKSGMLRGGTLSALPEWEAHTSAKDSSSLPTLTKTNASGNCFTPDRGQRGKERLSLAGMSKRGLLPTLCKSDSKGQSGAGHLAQHGMKRTSDAFLGQPLTPKFCEWFMGFPEGWTELNPLETAKFREWSKKHGGGSRNE